MSKASDSPADAIKKLMEKEAQSKGGKKSTKASARSARSAVNKIMDHVEGGIEGEGIPDGPSGKKVTRDRLHPVKRANGEEYLPRVLGDRTDVETLQIARAADIFVMLSGYPGTGKTALIEAAFNGDIEIVNGHGDLEVADLVGTYVPDPDEPARYHWVDGPLVRAMRMGTVLFVDDATLIQAPVLARLYPAMDGRRKIVVSEHGGEVIEAKDGFYVCAAHNPGAPGAIFSEALRSRFRVDIEIGTDYRMARQLGVNRRVVNMAQSLRNLRAKNEITWAPEMRELLAFRDVEKALGTTFAASNLIAVAPEMEQEKVAEIVARHFPDAERLSLVDRGGEDK